MKALHPDYAGPRLAQILDIAELLVNAKREYLFQQSRAFGEVNKLATKITILRTAFAEGQEYQNSCEDIVNFANNLMEQKSFWHQMPTQVCEEVDMFATNRHPDLLEVKQVTHIDGKVCFQTSVLEQTMKALLAQLA